MANTEISDINVKFENGRIHCTDGPAVVFSNGSYQYWHRGNLHRTDGPALFNADTPGYGWYLHGKIYDDFWDWLSHNSYISDTKKTYLILKWGDMKC